MDERLPSAAQKCAVACAAGDKALPAEPCPGADSLLSVTSDVL